MNTCVHLWYVADFFLEWEVFQKKKILEKNRKKYFMFCKIFLKIVPFMR